MSDWNKMSYTQVDVLRHGACEGGEIFRGSTDVHLNEEGWQQMDQSVNGLQWDQIVCSPLQRCHSYAKQLSEQQGIPVLVDDRWREFDFGVWEGRLRDEIWEDHGDDVMRFFSDPLSFTPEGGDSYLSVRERISEAWNELIESHSHKRVLLITHGGIFRALHALLKSLPSSAFNTLEVPYACLSRWKHYQYENNSQHENNGQYKSQGKAMLSFHNRQQS